MVNIVRRKHYQETKFLRIILIITILLNGYALINLPGDPADGTTQFDFNPQEYIVAIGLAALLLESCLLSLSWTPFREKLLHTGEMMLSAFSRTKSLNLLIFALSISLFAFFILGPWGEYAKHLSVRLFLLWLLVLSGSFLIKAWSRSERTGLPENWLSLFSVSLVLILIGYKTAFYFQNISFYPFTLTWSETSRYYYASLFLSNRIYGTYYPPTVLHPSRYLMQAVPFLLPGSPLWLHRAWQVFLWLGTSFFTALVLVRRLASISQLRSRLLILWIATFLLLGPVYYHLLVPVIIILWGFKISSPNGSGGRKGASFLCLFFASAWAGISRVNWFPMPGLLASALFLMETPVGNFDHQGNNKLKAFLDWNILRYSFKPILWTLFGTLAAFASQAAYIAISGNKADEFTTSFSSDLLWHRLLPNPTYPPGILPAAIAVSLPLFLIIFGKLIRVRENIPGWKRYHPIRYLGMTAILAVLFLGGLVVSVKIGGGSNLHNLDAYLTLLLVVSVYFYLDKTSPDLQPASSLNSHNTNQQKSEPAINSQVLSYLKNHQLSGKVQQIGIGLTLLITAILTIASGSPASPLPDQETIDKSFLTVKEFSNYVVQNGGEVLFISNRHLITFGDFGNVPLIPEYERVFLMEMAMANNRDYLRQFQEDIRSHRFAIIVTEPLSKSQKEGDEPFGAENNAWAKRISSYILCYYKPEKTFRPTQLQLLVPDPDSRNCP